MDPQTGNASTLATSARAYAVVRAPSGTVFFSAENALHTIDASGAVATVAQTTGEVGPVAVAPNGDVYYTTATQIFRLPGGAGPPVHVAGTGMQGGAGDGGAAVNAQLSAPHGIAIAADGALLVSDTGNDRLRRIDPATGVITAFAQVGSPRGIDVAADGTIYVIDSRQRRLVRLSATGAAIGPLGSVFGDPYDVEVAGGGIAYVLEAGSTGWVRRVAADGTVTTVSRRP